MTARRRLSSQLRPLQSRSWLAAKKALVGLLVLILAGCATPSYAPPHADWTPDADQTEFMGFPALRCRIADDSCDTGSQEWRRNMADTPCGVSGDQT